MYSDLKKNNKQIKGITRNDFFLNVQVFTYFNGSKGSAKMHE